MCTWLMSGSTYLRYLELLYNRDHLIFYCLYFNKLLLYFIHCDQSQLIVGILAFIIGVLALLLPETLGRPLTTTLEEAEALGHEPSKKKDGLEMKQHEVKA